MLNSVGSSSILHPQYLICNTNSPTQYISNTRVLTCISSQISFESTVHIRCPWAWWYCLPRLGTRCNVYHDHCTERCWMGFTCSGTRQLECQWLGDLKHNLRVVERTISYQGWVQSLQLSKDPGTTFCPWSNGGSDNPLWRLPYPE